MIIDIGLLLGLLMLMLLWVFVFIPALIKRRK